MSYVIAMFLGLVLAGVGYAIFQWGRQSGREEREIEEAGGSGGALPDESMGPHPTDLEIDDIVSYLGTDYMVEGTITFTEGGYEWYEFKLVDGSDVRWLYVEEDDVLNVSLWREIDDLQVSPPVPEHLEYEGEEYRMVERGEASAVQQGETGRKTHPEVEYWDFDGPGDALLSVEQWGGEIEVSKGKEVQPDMLDILSGSET